MLLTVLVLYLAVGCVVALGFVLCGVTRGLGHATPVSLGGRLMLFPGALALWPVVVLRWVRGR